MLKKYFICFVTLLTLTTSVKVYAASSTKNTGHSDIIELGFYDYHMGYQLLSEISKKEIDNAYKKVKRSAFGWNVKEINNKIVYLNSMEETFKTLGIKDGMTLSFHHHLRNGDFVQNMVSEEILKENIKDIKPDKIKNMVED